MNSRNDNMILKLTDQSQPELVQAARDLIGCSVFVGWPHLVEALVEAVATDEVRYCSVEMPPQERTPTCQPLIRSEPLTMDAQSIWHKEAENIQMWYENRRGVEIGDMYMLIYAREMSGRRYVCGQHGVVTLEKQWQSTPTVYAHQIVVKDIAVQDNSFVQFKTLDSLFPANTKVFLLGKPNYGALGEVMDVDKDEGRVRVNFRVLEEPKLLDVKRQYRTSSVNYYPAYSLAQRLGISSHLVSRITGTVYIIKGEKKEKAASNAARVNAGLNLKFNKTNKEVPGYTRKSERDWQYSEKVVQQLTDYMKQFPELFTYIAQVGSQNDNYYEDDVFGANKSTRLPELINYLKKLPSASVEPSPIGTDILEEETIQCLDQQVKQANELNSKKRRHVKMQVRPHLLHQPLEAQANSIPDPLTTYELLDRVVNVREGYSVPLGLRGTIIGICPAEKEQDMLYEVLFDEEFLGGLAIRCPPNRAYRMPSSAMINITFGEVRRDRAVQEQKSSATFSSPSARTSSRQSHQQQQQTKFVANGNHRHQPQQYQQQPPVRILQHPPRTSNVLTSGHQAATSSSSPHDPKAAEPRFVQTQLEKREPVITNKSSQPDFSMVWSQLQQKPIPSSSASGSEPQQKPVPSSSASTTSQSSAMFPPGPHLSGQMLCPPSSWLQSRPAESSDTSLDHAPELPCSNQASSSPKSTSKDAEKDVNHILSELFKSASLQDGWQQPPPPLPVGAAAAPSTSGTTFTRQLTVEELFKSVDERQQWKPKDNTLAASLVVSEDSKSEVVTTSDSSANSINLGGPSMAASIPAVGQSNQLHKPPGVNSSEGQPERISQPPGGGVALALQAPGSALRLPIRPTQVELNSESHTLSVGGINRPTIMEQQKQMPERQVPERQVRSTQQNKQPHLHQQQQIPSLLSGPLLNPSNRSAVQELCRLCQARGINQPQFETQWINDGRCQSRVIIGSLTSVGSLARTREQAIESAAGVALFELHNLPAPGMLPPGVASRPYFPQHSIAPPRIGASANSAFTPVQSRFAVNLGGQMHVPQPPVNMWQHHQQQQQRNYHSQQPLLQSARPVPSHGTQHDSIPTAARQRTTSSSAADQPGSYFVPTQVMRRQKTPHKETSKPSDASPPQPPIASSTPSSSAACETVERSVAEQHHKPSASLAPKLALQQPTTSSSSTVSQTSSSSATTSTPASTSRQQGKKARSRIAANFGALNQ
jgi:hypothetical protein